MHAFVGTSGFAYKPWKGPFYPADLKDDQMLAFYARHFRTVEINNTFYRMPKEDVLTNWAAQVPEDFLFVLKASRRITHIKRLKDDEDDSTGYLFSKAEALGAKLGPVLFQLPPNFKKDVPRLQAFLARIPKARDITLEVRNPTWLDDEVYATLREHKVALCAADMGGGDEDEPEQEVPLVATTDWGYLRLRRDTYTDADLHAWAERIRKQPWQRVFVFFKHEEEGQAPKLAARFDELFTAIAANPSSVP
jgi:uncharacterized protein YecE (DUF72 family)